MTHSYPSDTRSCLSPRTPVYRQCGPVGPFPVAPPVPHQYPGPRIPDPDGRPTLYPPRTQTLPQPPVPQRPGVSDIPRVQWCLPSLKCSPSFLLLPQSSSLQYPDSTPSDPHPHLDLLILRFPWGPTPRHTCPLPDPGEGIPSFPPQSYLPPGGLPRLRCGSDGTPRQESRGVPCPPGWEGRPGG